jgi:phosphoglycolate phosphatase-like HAD superfamily hydrolase
MAFTKRWRLAIFDWNGTLLNDKALMWASVVDIFFRFKLKPPSESDWFRTVTSNYMEAYHRYGIPEGPNRRLELNEIRRAFFERYWNSVSLTPGARDALDACRATQMRVALVSAEAGDVLLKRLNQFSLTGAFDFIRSDASDKVGALQHASAAFTPSMERRSTSTTRKTGLCRPERPALRLSGSSADTAPETASGRFSPTKTSSSTETCRN